MSASAQLKQLTAAYGRVVFIGLLLIGVVLSAGAYNEYTNPSTETVTEQRHQQQISSTTSTSARVTQDTELYEKGRVLQNMPVYFVGAAPRLTLNVSTSVPAGQTVSVTQRLSLRQRASRDGRQFWAQERTLLSDTTNVSDGDVASTTSLNMSEVINTTTERRDQITIGTFETELVLDISYETKRYTGEINVVVPVTIASDTYWLESELSGSNSHSTSVTREETQRNQTLIRLLAGGASVCFIGAFGIGYWRLRGPNVRSLEAEVAESRYSEWISEGEFPTGTDKQYIYIDSLEDLVDVAIDSNKRVIHDSEFDAYSVPDGDLVYYYAEKPTRIRSWIDLQGNSGA